MKVARAFLAFSVLCSVPALADDPPAPPPPPVEAAAAPATRPSSPSKSIVVSRDPVTGELRPATPEEREKLLGRKPLAKPERAVVTLPDGSQMMELGPEHASYTIAKKDANGKVTQSCVQGDPAKALAAPPAPAKPAAPAAEPKSER